MQNYQKYDFNESGKWLRVVGPIPIFSEFLGRGSEPRVILEFWGCLSILRKYSARRAAAPPISMLAGFFGSLLAQVWVLPKDL